jgi:oligoendopeptidase F
MSLAPLPTSIEQINVRQWDTFAPYFHELEQRELTPDTTRQWLVDWSNLSAIVYEALSLTYVEKSINTAETEKEAAFLDIINEVLPQAQVADQKLKERLLALPYEPEDDMALVMRSMHNAADLFREENVPLQTQLAQLGNEYDKITGALKVNWDGEEKNLSQLTVYLQEKDREVRERAWQAMMDLWLSKRAALNKMYADMLVLRQQLADNAGLPDYRAYAFREKERFEYTPEDCFTFHEAIEQVVVPATQRIYEKKRQRQGLAALRPWDIYVDTSDAPTLKPYQGQDALIQGCLNIFHHVDPVLAAHLGTMAEENLLDLETRPNKALGGFCTAYLVRKRPFIFMNGVGLHDNVQTMLHEAGHAFHVFATAELPLVWQMDAPMEFNEVASMSMELLASPYLTKEYGGFYTEAEAARARIEHLEGIITFLPYMAVVDAFQHWVYTHVDEAAEAANCDAVWDNLWARFMSGVNWEGFEDARQTGWHRKPHIFDSPFYYIEYGMAQVGALQVWRNSLHDHKGAVAAYRQALAVGSTKTLPELFAAAGAEFRFDGDMLAGLVALVEETIRALEGG